MGVWGAPTTSTQVILLPSYINPCRALESDPVHSPNAPPPSASPAEGLVEYEILNVLPFDSDRKRMSVILRHVPTRQIVLYTKVRPRCPIHTHFVAKQNR